MSLLALPGMITEKTMLNINVQSRNCAPQTQLAQGIADPMQRPQSSLQSVQKAQSAIHRIQTVDGSDDLLHRKLASRLACIILSYARQILIIGERRHKKRR
jgi:hypothetical protein